MSSSQPVVEPTTIDELVVECPGPGVELGRPPAVAEVEATPGPRLGPLLTTVVAFAGVLTTLDVEEPPAPVEAPDKMEVEPTIDGRPAESEAVVGALSVDATLIGGAGTSTVTVTITVFGGPPGNVEPGTWTMITCGGAVSGGAVGTGRVVDVTTEVVDVVVVSGDLSDRLINDAMIDPVTDATPIIAAAMIGPHLVRLMRPALATVSAPLMASDGTAGTAGTAGRAAGGSGAWLSSALTLSAWHTAS